MAEQQAEHRRNQEAAIVRSEIRKSFLGQCFAFVVAAALVFGGIFLLYFEKKIAGFGSIGTAVGSAIVVFWMGRRVQSRERTQK